MALFSILTVLALLLALGLLAPLAILVACVYLAIRRPKIVAALAGSLAMVVLCLVLGVAAMRDERNVDAQEIRVEPQSVRLSSASPTVTGTAASAEESADRVAAAPAADRPAWVEQPGQLHGSVYEVGVKSGLYVTAAECQRELEAAERAAVDDYLESYLGAGASRLVSLDAAFVRDYLQKAEFHEISTTSVGKMQQLHALLTFDDAARRIFRERWRQARVIRSLKIVGVGSATTLALLAAAYGYLSRSTRRARAERSLTAV